MPHVSAFLTYMSICLAAVAATATVSPALPRDSADTETVRRAAPAKVTPVEAVPAESAPPIAAARVSQRLEIEAALAHGRPPVPLLRQAPPPYIGPQVSDPAAVASKTEPSTKVEPPAKSNFSAKAKIEEDGYKSVRMLERGPDGKWRGRALRGQTEVAVLVDDQGNVSSQ
jgi:hypothetical protein